MAISVITIAYNDADGLSETLMSGAAQDTAFEQIVVDGGSTKDASVKILEDFDNLIDHWVSEPDGGIYDAMNKGVAMATGDFVVFMNAGDCFYDHRVIGRAEAFIAERAPDMFHGRAYARGGDKPYQYNAHLWQGMICSHQSTFAKRALLQQFPFSTDFKIVADYNFYVQCANSGVVLEQADIDVARIDTSGVSFSSFGARTEERMRVCRTYYSTQEVYDHFQTLFRKNGLNMPDWAQNMQAWIHETT